MTTLRWIASFHEAGHAVTALALDQPAFSLTVANDGSGLFRQYQPAGVTMMTEGERRQAFDRLCDDWKRTGGPSDLRAFRTRAIIKFSGGLAEHRIAGHLSGAGIDFEDINSMLDVLPESQREKFRDECLSTSSEIVQENWRVIERLAQKLHEHDFLNAEQISILTNDVRKHALPDETPPLSAPLVDPVPLMRYRSEGCFT